MPEGYTHIRTARQAAVLADYVPVVPKAFEAGANGPDILFCYQAWKPARRRAVDLPGLGGRMHDECTGAFLMELVRRAKTPAQRDYALGFLCHYAADCAVHPYVVMITEKGQLYGRKGGHGYFEIALDSYLHKEDGKGGAVPSAHACPHLVGAPLAQVGVQLQGAIQAVFGMEVSREALADIFHHTYWVRRLFNSRFKIKRGLFWLVEPLFGGRGAITGHVSPARLKGTGPRDKRPLPDSWTHPFTQETVQASVFQLLEQGARVGSGYILAARGYWQGKLTDEQLAQVVGSRSYLSGLEDPASRAKNAAELPSAKKMEKPEKRC